MSQNYIFNFDNINHDKLSFSDKKKKEKISIYKIFYTYPNNEKDKLTFLTDKIIIKGGLKNLNSGYLNIIYDNQQSIVDLFNMIDKLDSYFNKYLSDFRGNNFSFVKIHKTGDKKEKNNIKFHDYINVKFCCSGNDKILKTKFFKVNNGKYEQISNVKFDNINQYLKYNYICQFLINVDCLWSIDNNFGISLRCSEVIIEHPNSKCILETLPIKEIFKDNLTKLNDVSN
jgi:hypothetical protein